MPAPAGSLFLWDSRILHQGWVSGARLAQTVCWQPRSFRDAAARDRKLRLAALGLPSTHWATLGLAHPGVCGQGPSQPAHLLLPDKRTLAIRPLIRLRALVESSSAAELWKRFGPLDGGNISPQERRELERALDVKISVWL